jgi:hypothetical protein
MSNVYPFGENTVVRGRPCHLSEPINRPEPRNTHRFYAITPWRPVGFATTSNAKTAGALRKVARKLSGGLENYGANVTVQSTR